MKKESYSAPSIERIEIAIEQGFAASYPGGEVGDGGTVDYGE